MTPLSIYQAALDVVSEAVLAGDFATYAGMIDLPYLVLTDSAQLLVTCEADLRPTFDALHFGLKARRVHHYKRLARQADYVAQGRIEGWHFTHTLAAQDFAAPSRSARQVIVHRAGRWLFSEAQYPIAADSWPLSDTMLFAEPSRLMRPEGATP
jgi:hypothetical protein